MGVAALLLVLEVPPLPGAYPIPGPRADSTGTTLASSILSSDSKVWHQLTCAGHGSAQRAQELLAGGRDRKKEKQKGKLG